MSDNHDDKERDVTWFKQTFPFVATENEVEAFCERVAIRMADGMSESRARFETASELRKKRNA